MNAVSDDKQRFSSMAEEYDQMAPYLLPQYAFLQEEMIRQADLAALAAPRIVDLGAGSGIFIEKVMDRNLGAVCWWVDSSPDFLAVYPSYQSVREAMMKTRKEAIFDVVLSMKRSSTKIGVRRMRKSVSWFGNVMAVQFPSRVG